MNEPVTSPRKPPLLFVPTFNECENVAAFFEKASSVGLSLDFLFLDDNSPDGTGKILDAIAVTHQNVQVIHRPGKWGIGSAHKEGIAWAYQHGYDILITMDCDFTHDPAHIPDFLAKSEKADIVIGSRFLRAGSLDDWNIFRWFMTNLGHFLTRYLLKIPFDATGAFRVYRLDHIPQAHFSNVQSNGYSFFFESLFRLFHQSFKIDEIPIKLPSRTYGHSKMSYTQIFHSFFHLVHLYTTTLIAREAVPVGDSANSTLASGNSEWDKYWTTKNSISHIAFDLGAVFYRRFIIRPSLRHFIGATFAKGSTLLHAGCGGGQVDGDLHQDYRIIPLDISGKALSLYSRHNPTSFLPICGSNFRLPFRDESLDGIYNLGVLEHFDHTDIVSILSEFRRCLKADGRLLIFWPPVNGLSVQVLGAVHYLLRNVFGLAGKLHPDEISLLQSPKQAKIFCEASGLELEKYSFGLRDAYTHAVLVVRKAPTPIT